jgi:hypothetical protein
MAHGLIFLSDFAVTFNILMKTFSVLFYNLMAKMISRLAVQNVIGKEMLAPSKMIIFIGFLYFVGKEMLAPSKMPLARRCWCRPK